MLQRRLENSIFFVRITNYFYMNNNRFLIILFRFSEGAEMEPKDLETDKPEGKKERKFN